MLTDKDQRQVDRLRSVPFASASASLSASAAQAFSVLERPGHLEPFHPFCQENTALAWDESERRDRIVYLNGKILDRQFVQWTPNEGFELLIGESTNERSLVHGLSRMTLLSRQRSPSRCSHTSTPARLVSPMPLSMPCGSGHA